MSTPVHAAIAKRFAAPEYATFFEVRDDAGFRARRSADVVAMNLWPSRGLHVWGFEVKVSRTDWLRELKNPAKSSSVQKYCDRWWLAVNDDKLLKDGELPETWGLFVLQGGKLFMKKEAPVLKAQPLTRGFVACLLRNATDGTVPKSALHDLVAAEVEQRVEARKGSDAWALKAATEREAKLHGAIAEFEKKSGVRIAEWNAGRVGEAVQLVMSEGNGAQMLKRLADQIERIREQVDRAAKELAGNTHLAGESA